MKVVGIHGIAQDFLGSPQLENAWLPALQGSLELIEQPRLTRSEFGMVFYGDLFRPSGMRSAGVPKLTAQDVETEWEKPYSLSGGVQRQSYRWRIVALATH